MPITRETTHANVEMWCEPTLDTRIASMRHIAVEGRCLLLSDNSFARRGDYAGFFVDGPAFVISRGPSCVVDPFGKFVAGPDFKGEAILAADIDRSAVARGNYAFNATGHYARPDVFRLAVEERRRSPAVTFTDEGPSRSARNLSKVAG